MNMHVAAAPAVALPSTLNDWLHLKWCYHLLSDALHSVSERLGDRKLGHKKWEERKPFPKEPLYSSYQERINDFPLQNDAEKTWKLRYETALRNGGIGLRLGDKFDALQKQLDNLAAEIADTEPLTLEELGIKARIATAYHHPMILKVLPIDIFAAIEPLFDKVDKAVAA